MRGDGVAGLPVVETPLMVTSQKYMKPRVFMMERNTHSTTSAHGTRGSQAVEQVAEGC